MKEEIIQAIKNWDFQIHKDTVCPIPIIWKGTKQEVSLIAVQHNKDIYGNTYVAFDDSSAVNKGLIVLCATKDLAIALIEKGGIFASKYPKGNRISIALVK